MPDSRLTLRWPDADLSDDILKLLTSPGAPFEIVDDDVLGVTMPVFAKRAANLRALLGQAAERFGDRPYVVFPDRSLTYRSILDPVAAVAAVLHDQYGVRKGDRVAIAAANTVEWVLTFWATTALGAVTVALNGWWTGPEMAYALDLTAPKVLLGDERRLARVDGHDVAPPVVVFERDFAALEASGAGASLPDVEIDEDDPFLILFTSGTTGRPKGALLSHRSNIHFIMSTSLRGAENMLRSLAPGEAPAAATPPVTISASPMFHVSGLNCQIVMAAATGMTIVYAPPGKWREDVHLSLTAQHGATVWSLVPTQLWRLLDWPDLDEYDTSSLQTIGGGSAVWAPELLRTVGEKLPWVRPKMGLGYGASETNGLGTTLRAAMTFEHPESVGEAGPTVEIEIRDPVSREPLGENEVGEICMRSAANFIEYWNNPEATRSALDDDRWYHTGDFGFIRSGFVYLSGRRQDLIIRGGENIYPAEIENRAIEHPAVAEVVVVGVEHPTLGQEVKAYVVLHDGSALTADELGAWVGEALAKFKVPSQIEFVDGLPHNASGKVLKHLLGKPVDASDFVEE